MLQTDIVCTFHISMDIFIIPLNSYSTINPSPIMSKNKFYLKRIEMASYVIRKDLIKPKLIMTTLPISYSFIKHKMSCLVAIRRR